MEIDTQYRNTFLNAMANGLDFPMWVKDINGTFLFINTVCANTILKTTVEKALNLTDVDFREDALAPICMKSDKHVQETLKTLRCIEHARYNDGRDIWLDIVKTPLIVDGKLIGIIGTAKDISALVPKEIRDRCAKPGLIEIDLNLEYYMGANFGEAYTGLLRVTKGEEFINGI
jgi:PAS domain-containing protein